MVDPGFLVDRSVELERLEELWSFGEPGLVVVYGRRRVGKTRLLVEWAKNKPVAYYQAGLWSHKQNLEGLVEAIADQLGVEEIREAKPENLRSLFRLLVRLEDGKRIGVIIDEITYWVRIAEPVTADLQWIVDHLLPSTRMLLVLSGSLIGVVEKSILGGGAPLYGRARLRMKLEELPPWCISLFTPNYTPQQLVEVYSLVGGIPYYLKLIDDTKPPLEAWLKLFEPQGILQDEPLFLLRDELRDPHSYLAIARSLARGATTLGKAASKAGLPTSHASRYMKTLVDLGVVEELPVLYHKRKKLYRLKDKPLRSWLALAETCTPQCNEEKLEENKEKLISETWEEIAAKHASQHIASKTLKTIDEQGKLITRSGEIDWIIISHKTKTIIAVEAKWATLNRIEAKRITQTLETKAHRLLPASLQDYKIIPLVYAKKCNNCPKNIITPDKLPWRTNCR